MTTTNPLDKAIQQQAAADRAAGQRHAADHIQRLVDHESEHSPEAELRNLVNAATVHEAATAREAEADRRRLEARRAVERQEAAEFQAKLLTIADDQRRRDEADMQTNGGPVAAALLKLGLPRYAAAHRAEQDALEARITALEAAINKR